MTFWVAVHPAAGLAFHKILLASHASSGSDTKIRDLGTPCFAFDRDLLTLHRPDAFKQVYVDGNLSIVHETTQVRSAVGRAKRSVQ